MNVATQNHQNSSMLVQANAQAQAAAQMKPDGAFTHRIRSLAGRADEHEFRLRNLLRHLRVPPPEPVSQSGSATGLNVVHTTIEEQLARSEAAQAGIEAAISELESLFS